MPEQERGKFPKPWAERIEHISTLVSEFTGVLRNLGATTEEIAMVYTGAVTRLLEQQHGVDK